MSIANEIKAINESARKIHGSDIHILVCRCIHFGNDDNLIIISGKNHHLAALDFVKVTPGAILTEEFRPEVVWDVDDVSPAHTVSVVTF
ncbi:hypothetical protein [Pseudomonas sp.]|mgnify:FL=1|uniref:hypothetical protein n=1 Tax=Pseudomonas sp. TaxID=306 RepID=UPI003FD7D2B9